MQHLHSKEFGNWFESHIANVRDHENVPEEICWLSRGPSFFIKSYKGYILNGVKFQTTALSLGRKTQNNGVYLSATTSTWTSNDNSLVADLSYHGVVDNVYEVCYGHSLKFPMFLCKWFDGLKVDDFGLMSVRTSHAKYGKEPFIMAEQARQCFYVQDPVESSISFVLKRPPREIFDVDDENSVDVYPSV